MTLNFANNIKFVTRFLLGNIREFDLSHRIYSSINLIISFMGLVGLLLFSLASRVHDTSFFVALDVGFTAIFSFLYYLSRFRKRVYPFFFIGIVLVFSTLVYIISGGKGSDAIYVYILVYMIFIAILDKSKYLLVTILVLTSIAGLVFIDSYLPHFLENHVKSQAGQYYFLFPMIMIFSGSIIVVIKMNYNEKNILLQRQKDEIEDLYQNVTDSVRYATQIQQAIIPSRETVSSIIPNSFVLFLPKDMVSGDFYWVAEVEGKKIVVAADCTGHGVPGAFMSMLGVSLLNEIVVNKKILQTHEMLNKLRESVKKNLTESTKDGMDIAVVVIDEERMKLQFSGANSPLIMIRSGELSEIKGDRQPIGKYLKEREFTSHEIDIQKDDVLYMFSDGYRDQVGGARKGKFMFGNFKQLLVSIHSKPMDEQHEILLKTFNDWKNFVKTDAISLNEVRELLMNSEISEQQRKMAFEKLHSIQKDIMTRRDVPFKEIGEMSRSRVRDELIELYVKFVWKDNAQIDDVMVLGFKI